MGRKVSCPTATTWVVQDLVFTAPCSSHCRAHVSLPTRHVGFGLRLDLQSFVHWYASEGRDFRGQFPVSSVLTRVDRLFFSSRDRWQMTSNEIMINHVTIKVQYRVDFLRDNLFGIKITCNLCCNLVFRNSYVLWRSAVYNVESKAVRRGRRQMTPLR